MWLLALPHGGLGRRGGYIRSVRRRWPGAAAVLLDGGNFFDQPGLIGDVKTRGLVRGMNYLGYRLAAVGERDLVGGFEHFQETTGDARFPIICANLVREDTRIPLLPPATLVVAGELKIGVVGLMRHNPALRLDLAGGGHAITVPALPALENALMALRDQSDLIVLLATMPLEDVRLLVRRVSEVELVLGAFGSRATSRAVIEGRARILYVGDQGKNLGQVNVYRGSSGSLSLEPRLVQINEKIPPDPHLEQLVVEVLADAQDAERATLTAMDPSGEGGTGAYLGAGACAACHSAIVEDWSSSAHALALESLKREPNGMRPACIACHVTGYGQVGGWVDQRTTPHLAGVGCEACHGPGASHVAHPKRPYGRISLPTCTSCHTVELDPDFNYYGDLPLVSH
ncbi:MAG: multiheme c-type cytochrome [Acidobacteriota bacterium]|nr:multiheme c-type cytochrome [Acidobacteriota bacterium]